MKNTMKKPVAIPVEKLRPHRGALSCRHYRMIIGKNVTTARGVCS